MKRARILNRLLTLVGLGLATACAAPVEEPSDSFERTRLAIEGSSFLAGETLVQREHKMQRTHRDLKFFHQTLDSLRRHRSRGEIRQMREFLTRYMEVHVRNVMANQQDGWSPELVQLDANLLFAQADLLIDLKERERLGELVTEIRNRLEADARLVVEYPIGQENTLKDAFAHVIGVHRRL